MSDLAVGCEVSPRDRSAGTEVSFRFAAPSGAPTVCSARVEDVLAATGLAPQLDLDRTLGLLSTGYFDSHRSFFAGVDLVPPHVPMLRAADGKLREGVAAGPAPRTASPAEAAPWLLETLLAEIRPVLASARRPAVTLSGGLDSSAVAWAASRVWRELGRSPESLRAYHHLPPSGPTEEKRARVVADSLGMELVALTFALGDPWEGAEDFLARLPIPPDGGGISEVLAFHRRLRDDGVDVVLTGDGGDEALTAHAEDDLGVIRRRLRSMGRRVARPLLRRRRRAEGLRGAPDWLRSAMEGVPIPEASPRARGGLTGAAASRDRLLRCSRQQAIVAFHRALDECFGTRTACPFLGRALLDLLVSLPAAAVAGDGRPKGLLRLALRGLLPPSVLDQSKDDQPYVEPQRVTELERHWRDWRTGLVREGVLDRSGLLTIDEAESLAGTALEGDLRALMRVNAIVGLEVWARARHLPPVARS